MSIEKEIIRQLKLELEDMKSVLKDMEATLQRWNCPNDNNEAERRIKEYHQTLIATVLKYGTMVAPNTMEITVSSDIATKKPNEMTITYHPERNENTVRVRRV